ncbi:MAG: precorrin-8X methylmutase [Fimbriimonadaceae bacterium]|nr:precorrin-8X methylmutase [Alphaproteobacteria bacterium]
MEYIRDPDAIYRRSFEIIGKELDLTSLPSAMHGIATRMVHSCGMTDLVADLRFSADFVNCAAAALKSGAPIIVDSEMTGAGMIRRVLTADNEIVCKLNDPNARSEMKRLGTTRSAAGLALAEPLFSGAVIVIGNAPTALFQLLEMIDRGATKPAAIIGLPVGFVGAAESKAELNSDPRGIPFLTLLGRRGGSALAAAALNASAIEISETG